VARRRSSGTKRRTVTAGPEARTGDRHRHPRTAARRPGGRFNGQASMPYPTPGRKRRGGARITEPVVSEGMRGGGHRRPRRVDGGGADGPAGRWGTEGSWKARPWAETLHHWREWNGCTAGEGPSAEPPEDASDDCRPAGCEEEGRKEEGRRRGVWPKPNQVNPAPIRWSAADHHQSRDPLRLQSGNVLAGYWVYFKNKGDWQRRHVPRRPLRSLRWN